MTTNTLIVLTDYENFNTILSDKQSRIDCGVLCSPVSIGNKWCLPLGWEEKLDEAGIGYTIEELTWKQEEI